MVAATPPTWASSVTTRGYYVGLRGRRPSGWSARLRVGADVVAGSAGQQCPRPTQACGDGGPATRRCWTPRAGLAVGLDGSLYIADPGLLRVRRIDPGGTITTVAGQRPGVRGAHGRVR